MRIAFSPVASADGALGLHRAGDVLTINGRSFDFAPLPEGGRLPRAALDCPELAGDVTRAGGRIALVLALPHGDAAPAEVRFPAPLDLEGDGPVFAPGLVPPAGVPVAGAIDWTALVTAEAAAEAARTDWRREARLTRAQFMAALIGAGIATREEVFAMRGGVPPAALAPVFAALPEDLADAAILLMAEAQTFERLDPILLALGAALGWSEGQQDALFGWDGDA